MTEEVTIKLEKTKCCYCSSEFVTMEQYDRNFKRYKHDSWLDLTDDEMLMIYGQNHEGKKYNLGRMVQQALKEKNT